MTMSDPAPRLEQLTRWLAEAPPEFLLAPRTANQGIIHTGAVAADLLDQLGARPDAEWSAQLGQLPAANRNNRLQLIQLACWLLHHPWFRERPGVAPLARAWLEHGLSQPAELVSAPHWVQDPDRREELVRLTLAALRLLPAGETPVQFRDRLAALDSVARHAVFRESEVIRQQEMARQKEEAERQRKVQEELERKAREEAATKTSRE